VHYAPRASNNGTFRKLSGRSLLLLLRKPSCLLLPLWHSSSRSLLTEETYLSRTSKLFHSVFGQCLDAKSEHLAIRGRPPVDHTQHCLPVVYNLQHVCWAWVMLLSVKSSDTSHLAITGRPPVDHTQHCLPVVYNPQRVCWAWVMLLCVKSSNTSHLAITGRPPVDHTQQGSG